MTRFLQYMHADTAFETDTPVSWKEAVGFLLGVVAFMVVAFLMHLEFFAAIAVVGVIGGVLVLQSPMTWMTLSILGFLGVFWAPEAGMTPIELLHSMLIFGGMLWWTFHRLVIAKKPIEWTVGGLLFFALFLQMVLMVPLSLGYDADGYILLRELAILSTILLFIPIAHEADTFFKQKVLFGAMVVVLSLLAVRNIYTYKTRVIEAVYAWQVGASRSAETFFLIFIATVIGAALLISAWRFRSWIFWAAFFVLGAAATILSFYRTLWVAFFVSVATMGVVLGAQYWKRGLAYFAVSIVLLGAMYPVFLEDVIPFDVMWRSISARFESIGEYGQDVSVRNRDAEAWASIDDIDGNWFLGKGLSTPVQHYKLTTESTIFTTWTHNGYAWILNHYGILGTLLLFSSYFAYIFLGLRMERQLRRLPDIPPHIRFRWRTAIACGIAIIVANFFVSITVNQFLSHEGGLVFAMVYGLFEAWRRKINDLEKAKITASEANA
ncbi:hypothetical protein KQI65_00550 [bacterium]|nr:hypothetical protein [bacterium]